MPTTTRTDKEETLELLKQVLPTQEVFNRIMMRIGNDKDKSLNYDMIKRWRVVALEILKKFGVTRWAGVRNHWYGYIMTMIWNDDDMEQTMKFRDDMLQNFEYILNRNDRIRIREEKYDTKELGFLAKLLKIKMKI